MTRTEAEKLASVVFVCFGLNQLEWTDQDHESFVVFTSWIENNPELSAAGIVRAFAISYHGLIIRAREELEPHAKT